MTTRQTWLGFAGLVLAVCALLVGLAWPYISANDVAWRVHVGPDAELMAANDQRVAIRLGGGSPLRLDARDGSPVDAGEQDTGAPMISASDRHEPDHPIIVRSSEPTVLWDTRTDREAWSTNDTCQVSQGQGTRVLRCHPPTWLRLVYIAAGQPSPYRYQLHDSDGQVRAAALVGGKWGWNVAGEDWLALHIGEDVVMIRR